MPAGEVVDGWLSEAIEVVEVLHRVWRAERLLIHSATAVPMTEEVGTAAVVVLVGAGHEYLQYEVDQHTNALTWLDSHFYGTPKHVRTYDGMAGEVSAWAECFVQWRLLAQFARARGVVFRNATGFSMIDSIDRGWGEE